MPEMTIDPIVAASSLVNSLQSIISRTISPLEAGVVSVTQIHAGDAFNVIPTAATIRGTIRALSTEKLISLRDKVERMTHSTAEAHACNSTITYLPDFYPPVINDAELFEFSKEVVARVSHEGYLRETDPTMGGEGMLCFGFFVCCCRLVFFSFVQATHQPLLLSSAQCLFILCSNSQPLHFNI